MTKLSRQNVGGIDYTMVGCTLTGVCASAASDYVKAVTLSDGDILSDGMYVVITFANGNTAGTAPASLTIYSSDQTNYYSDSGLTQPFTLAPSGCCEIEYTGTGNAYTYTSYPVIQIEGVTAPLCDSCGKKTSGAVWDAGDTVLMLYSGNKFMVISGLTNVVTAGSKKAVTSGGVYSALHGANIASSVFTVTANWIANHTTDIRKLGNFLVCNIFVQVTTTQTLSSVAKIAELSIKPQSNIRVLGAVESTGAAVKVEINPQGEVTVAPFTGSVSVSGYIRFESIIFPIATS